eukprot:4247532-Alexandrium_andersonii.AAC.1
MARQRAPGPCAAGGSAPPPRSRALALESRACDPASLACAPARVAAEPPADQPERRPLEARPPGAWHKAGHQGGPGSRHLSLIHI